MDLVLGDLVKSTKFEIWREGWTTSSWLRLLRRRCGSEGPHLDRGGSVVETFAQDWSPVNREVQHECADSHQRASTLLGERTVRRSVQKALRCRGLQWWRWRQLFGKEGRKSQMGRTASKTFQIYRWEERRCTETDRHFSIQPTRNNHTTERNAQQQLVK